ncbi:hypothetical protein QN277_029458 [Acacia crassicarpa]|uniref:Uncharacterized protein n=1 Tax=Acacia crassicarpa TaxID=499986 RepID=A0AAE1ME72_9FABA|nr:hypothetical protein QN277_029458 [Acacia crassicarpa]
MCDNRNSEKEIIRVTSENASKRNLPSWMLPKVAAATTPLRNSVAAEKNCTSEKEAPAEAPHLTENNEIALKKVGAGLKRKTSRRKSSSNAERKVKRRNLNEEDASNDGNATQKDKKKKDSSKVRSLKSSSKRSQIVEDPNCGDTDANSVQGFNDGDIELTIEDLMTIAEEYVKDYEKKKQREASNSQCESVRQFPKTGEYGNSLDSHCERKISSTPERGGLYSSTSNKTGELVPIRTSRAGDPAQEMLELLLGPLPKPLEKRNKSIIDGVEFTQEPPGKSQVQFSGEDKVPLTKRKCSFKDKVALFLD